MATKRNVEVSALTSQVRHEFWLRTTMNQDRAAPCAELSANAVEIGFLETAFKCCKKTASLWAMILEHADRAFVCVASVE